MTDPTSEPTAEDATPVAPPPPAPPPAPAPAAPPAPEPPSHAPPPPAPAPPAPPAGPTPRSTPPHPAALIVAATLSFLAAAATIAGLFPDFWQHGTYAIADQTGPLAQQLVFALSMLLVGVALLRRGSSTQGAAAAAVIVAIGVQPRVVELATFADRQGPRGDLGFSLTVGAAVLALLAALMAAAVELRPRAWALRGHARGWTTLAALLGFATAVGYAMEPFQASTSKRSPFSFAFGGPFESLGGPRTLWAAILVVVLLSVVPATAVAVGRTIGVGLGFGLLGAIAGIAAARLGEVLGTTSTVLFGVGGAEGTWTFLAAGGATLLVVFGGLAVGRRRDRRATAAPEGAPEPAPDPPTEPPTDPDVPVSEAVAPRTGSLTGSSGAPSPVSSPEPSRDAG